jgi:hypothetical protein
MRRSASEVLRNLESRIARLEKSSSLKFQVQVLSDHNPHFSGKVYDLDLKGLRALMGDLESSMREEIEGYLTDNPQDEFNNFGTEFYQVQYNSSRDVIYLYNGTHTEESELFSYTIVIKEASKFAFALMGSHPLFKSMEHEAF